MKTISQLLEAADDADLSITVAGEQLVIEGPADAELVARELIKRKPEVMAELAWRNSPAKVSSSHAGSQPLGSGDGGEGNAVVTAPVPATPRVAAVQPSTLAPAQTLTPAPSGDVRQRAFDWLMETLASTDRLAWPADVQADLLRLAAAVSEAHGVTLALLPALVALRGRCEPYGPPAGCEATPEGGYRVRGGYEWPAELQPLPAGPVPFTPIRRVGRREATTDDPHDGDGPGADDDHAVAARSRAATDRAFAARFRHRVLPPLPPADGSTIMVGPPWSGLCMVRGPDLEAVLVRPTGIPAAATEYHRGNDCWLAVPGHWKQRGEQTT